MKRVVTLAIYKPAMRELQVYEKNSTFFNKSVAHSDDIKLQAQLAIERKMERKMVQDINFGSEEIAYSRAMCDAVYGAF